MQRGIVRRHDDIGEEGLHMGWFSDAFEVGAGATLGSLAAVGAVHVGASVLSGIDAKKFAEYRAEHFDPVVFDADIERLSRMDPDEQRRLFEAGGKPRTPRTNALEGALRKAASQLAKAEAAASEGGMTEAARSLIADVKASVARLEEASW